MEVVLRGGISSEELERFFRGCDSVAGFFTQLFRKLRLERLQNRKESKMKKNDGLKIRSSGLVVVSAILSICVVQSAFAGSLVAWGYNGYGGCNVPDGDDFKAITAGHIHSLALKSNGSIVARGDNRYGQCNVPSPNIGYKAIASSVGDHSLALKSDGSLVAWGKNNFDQCIVTPPNEGFKIIAAGGEYSLALKSDGSLVAWGKNDYRQLDDVPAGNNFKDIAAGGYHGLALKSDGSLVAWGRNDEGQCDVPAGNNFEDIAAGGFHCLALRSDGSIDAWGDRTRNQCDVPGPNIGYKAIAAGGIHSVAIKSDGSIAVWGANNFGQLDNIPAGNNFTAIAAGGYHSLAITGPALLHAGENVQILSSQQAATVICGTASDADGDALEYRWLEGDAVLLNWTEVPQTGQCCLDLAIVPALSVGDHTLTVEVRETGTTEPPMSDTMVLTVENSPSADMVYIPGGEFGMGDSFGDGWSEERPVHTVTVDSFYMGRYEVMNQQYCDYLNSALAQGLITVSGGVVYQAGSGTTYPYCSTSSAPSGWPYAGEYTQITYNGGVFSVRTTDGRSMVNDPMVCVSWYGSVAYCNWRSQQAGREQCYNLATWNCDFSKNGYRLATEAEWEYAARGGLSGQRFPWGDTITHSQANYHSRTIYAYDVSPTRGYHPTWNDGIYPYTSPVGSFAANDYSLYDMTGNVWEWCNDWWSDSYYSSSPANNPTGPTSGSSRVYRGCGWGNDAFNCRVARRNYYYPTLHDGSTGFRVARSGNLTPDVDAGENLAILSENQASTVVCGTASDPEGDSLEYRWVEGEVVLLDWTPVPESGQCCLDRAIVPALSVGDHTLTLDVRETSEGGLSASDDMVLTVENSPPEAQPSPSHQVVEIGIDPIVVIADVADFDGDALVYEWVKDGVVLASGIVETPPGGGTVTIPELYIEAGDTRFPLGVHTIELIVNDRVNPPVAVSVTAEVKDSTAPSLSPLPSVTILWPPNHTLQPVTIAANAFDNGGGAITLGVTVESSEPADTDGGGNTIPDYYIDSIDSETGMIELRLRSERSGKGDGRTYAITVSGTDESGNSSVAIVTIRAPHDKRKK